MTTQPFEHCKSAVVNGTTLAYREMGDGEPVVLLHGDISDLRTWDRQVPPLGAVHRVVAYSRRFFRPNEAGSPEADYSWTRHVDDLLALLHAIDVAPAHIVGNSSGAYIGLLAAIREPSAVRTLVLEEPPVIPLFTQIPPRPAEVLRLLTHEPRTAFSLMRFGVSVMFRAQRAFRRGDDEKGMRTFARGVLGGPAYFDRLSAARLEQMRDNVVPIKEQLLAGGLPPLAEADLRSMTVPTLIVTGQHSAPSMNRLMDRLEELLPDVERITIPNASHFMHEDDAPAVNRAILDFLARHSS